MFHLVFVEPRIPPNTGNAIRLVAATGRTCTSSSRSASTMADAKLRRAGLDYHDLATVTVHATLDDLWAAVLPAQVYRVHRRARRRPMPTSTTVAGDVLMFGPEPTGLSAEVLADPHITDRVRIPMLAGVARSTSPTRPRSRPTRRGASSAFAGAIA